MKKKIEFTPIEFPQFSDSFIHFAIESDREKINLSLKERGYDYIFKGEGLTVAEEGKDAIIILRSKRTDVAVHEATHAVFHLMSNMGIKDMGSQEIQEIYAYLVEYVVKEILK